MVHIYGVFDIVNFSFILFYFVVKICMTIVDIIYFYKSFFFNSMSILCTIFYT